MMNELEEIIKSEISAKGRITFERFMDLALYHDLYGYYSSGNVSIGKVGDFYTSPYVNKAFGEVLSKFIIKSLKMINSSSHVIIEIGGGNGTLAKDLMDTLKFEYPAIYNNVKYKYIENSTNLLGQARDLLKDHLDKIDFINDLSEIEDEEIEGVVISNELFDALPFHRMIMNNAIIKETYVALQNNQFVETTDIPSTDELQNYVSDFNLDLIDGQQFEISLGIREALSEICRILKKGIVLTIDYGYLAKELYSRSRIKGTYKCMKGHTINEYPFRDIGEQDITAHVNFSDLIQTGNDLGLREIKYTTQGQFLIDWGILDIIENISKQGEESKKKISSVKNLFLPGSMGNKFKVLIQEKNLDREIKDFYPGSPFQISFDIV